MLRAVWSGDRDGFYRAWNWTRANLANADGLLAWRWRQGDVADPRTSTDADTDTALALLMASKRWNDFSLYQAGVGMVRSIWQREVVQINGAPHLTAGDWAAAGPVVAVNPSHFAPYAYHVFKEVDNDHVWLGLIDLGYRGLGARAVLAWGLALEAGGSGLPHVSAPRRPPGPTLFRASASVGRSARVVPTRVAQ